MILKGHQIIGELRRLVGCDSPENSKLKGHQIIGELRLNRMIIYIFFVIERSPDHWWVTTSISSVELKQGGYWKVTRSLVSYDSQLQDMEQLFEIERSPDHWWVTTNFFSLCSVFIYWKVTRSLVSYDLLSFFSLCSVLLKGHQIIGELRPSNGIP